MIRFVPIVLAVMALALPQAAQAKRGGGFFGAVSVTHEQVLRPVMQVDADNSLCHLIDRRRLFDMLGLWMTSEGYVLGEVGCTGTSYAPFAASIADMKAQGALPADLPESPRFTPQDYLEGFGLWGIVGGLLAIALLGRGLSGRKRKLRQEILTLEDGPAFRMIDVMCHAAIADGKIDDAEVAYIRDVARELTGLDYSDAHIRETIRRADRLKRPEHLAAFAKGLTLQQRHLILQAALSVVAADGHMDRRENRFIGLLVKGFGLARDDLDQALRILASRRATAAPA